MQRCKALHCGCTETTNTRHKFLSFASILLFTPSLLLGILEQVAGGTAFTSYVLGTSIFQHVRPLTGKDCGVERKAAVLQVHGRVSTLDAALFRGFLRTYLQKHGRWAPAYGTLVALQFTPSSKSRLIQINCFISS